MIEFGNVLPLREALERLRSEIITAAIGVEHGYHASAIEFSDEGQQKQADRVIAEVSGNKPYTQRTSIEWPRLQRLRRTESSTDFRCRQAELLRGIAGVVLQRGEVIGSNAMSQGRRREPQHFPIGGDRLINLPGGLERVGQIVERREVSRRVGENMPVARSEERRVGKECRL